MEISIDQILQAIGKMTAAELDQVMIAIGARLDQLETTDPEARGIRQAIRATRSRVSGVRSSNGSLASGVREGMRQAREEVR